MKPSLAFVVAAALFVPACNKDDSADNPESKSGSPEPAPRPIPPGGKPAPTQPAAPSLPTVPPLTDSTARAVLHQPLENVGGDDLSRMSLLYLADLGDKDGAEAAKKLLEMKDGKYDDKTAAAIGIEALLAYGEPGAGAKAVDLVKHYAADEEAPDEYLIHALAAVASGPEKDAAVAELAKMALPTGEEAADMTDVSLLATEALAKMAPPAARETFAKIAADKKQGGQIRGAAVAGLLKLGDGRGKSLGEALVLQATAPAEEPKPGVEPDDPPLADEVIAGLGVEGALDAGALIQKAIDAVLADETNAGQLECSAAATSIARIYAKGGGQSLAPWLRELATKDNAFHEDEANLALWAVGDDSAAQAVADQLKGAVSAWAGPNNMDGAIEILDIAARRGVARGAAFRVLVDAAAQVGPPPGAPEKQAGVNYGLRMLNAAAAHAFLKSAAK